MNIKVNAEAAFNTRELSVLRKLLARMSVADHKKLGLGEADIGALTQIYVEIDEAFQGFTEANSANR